MANLTSTGRLKLEKLLDMGGGYVLDFTNSTFHQFIGTNSRINIYSDKYEIYGDSKAKRLKAFWDIENDQIVGKIIIELIKYWRTSKELSESAITEHQKRLSRNCEEIAYRLLGKEVSRSSDSSSEKSESDFLKENFGEISLDGLNIESGLINVLDQRIEEIQKCLKSKASLSVIFLCGSVLEGILLSVATKNPKEYNQAKTSPKDKTTGKVLALQKWSLNDLINVSHEVKELGLDVKRFSHVLRSFRNFIHPYEQWHLNFRPDENTALICWQVLKAAINDLSNKDN